MNAMFGGWRGFFLSVLRGRGSSAIAEPLMEHHLPPSNSISDSATYQRTRPHAASAHRRHRCLTADDARNSHRRHRSGRIQCHRPRLRAHADSGELSCDDRLRHEAYRSASGEFEKGGRKREWHHRHHEAASARCNDVGHIDSLSSWKSSGRELSVLESRFCSEGGRYKKREGASITKLVPVARTTSASLPIQEFGCKFASLPDDILRRIAGSFSWPTLWSATGVCRSWSQALAPFREAMLFVHWGKKYKHGRGGVVRNVDKALDSFLKGAVRGCAAAMVDAGLLLWEMGRRQEGIHWYKQAAELGDPAGQCNLGLAYLQDPSNPTEAVKWFQRAALAGHVGAQYSLALCLQQGRGLKCSAVKAARWYHLAADGGNARAMYNLALCYRNGEGVNGDHQEAKRWMKRAAFSGHHKAQFEHGLTLFAESDGGLALVFLELATRAGETAATNSRDALLQQLSPKLCADAITCADHWQAKLSLHT